MRPSGDWKFMMLKHAVICMHKTTHEGWNPYSLFRSCATAHCYRVLKITHQVWDPYRLVSLVLKHAVLHAHNDQR